MKNLIYLPILIILLTACAPIKKTPTPLELQVIQSRKFNKPPAEVGQAIQTWCKDMDGQAIGNSCLSQRSKYKFEYSFTYESKDLIPKTTIVRLRFIRADGTQEIDPDLYSSAFKEIADMLFIQALPITPATME